MEALSSFSTIRLSGKQTVKAAWVVCIAMLVLVVAWIAYSEISSQRNKQAELAPQDVRAITRRSGPAYQVRHITSANLFGDPAPKKEVVKNIPTTTLQLKAIGILWASEQQQARAIIQSGNKPAKLYGVGDRIQGAGVSIDEIREGEILLDRNGAKEKLPLVKKKGSEGIISFQSIDSDLDYATASATEINGRTEIRRSSPKPISPNGEPRKIRKPNFSGLDRALQKAGEI